MNGLLEGVSFKNTCEKVLRKKTNKKKDWMSYTTLQKVEDRRKMKEKINNEKTRAHKNDAFQAPKPS